MAEADNPADILDELVTLGLGMARDLHARQAVAETASDAAQLAEAFHKISRSVRQSLALKARLARAERQDRLPAARDVQELRALTRARVREGCARLIWTEAEGDEAERLEDRLDTLLDTADLTDDDLGPVMDQIAAIARRLGLQTPPDKADPSPTRPIPPKDGQPEKFLFEWRIVNPDGTPYTAPVRDTS